MLFNKPIVDLRAFSSLNHQLKFFFVDFIIEFEYLIN